ncbi:MAG: hypothetical protein ACTHK5_11530 [Tsuneonella sp.]
MKRLAAFGLLGLGLAQLAAPLIAQQSDDRARLDDFAIPAASEPSRIEQLSPAATHVESAVQAVDRAIARPPMPDKRAAGPAQLSSASDKGSPRQLSDTGDSKNLRTAAVSSKADSTPGPVVHLKGHDRCDPQLDERKLAECRRILELRADEFHAPAPPQLSPEERLLAQQRAAEFAGHSPAQRLRMATRGEPDADLTSNQVLASIYLDTNAPPAQPTETPAPGSSADVTAILKAIGMDTPPPPQN